MAATDCLTKEVVVACEDIVVGRQSIKIQHPIEFCTSGNDQGMDEGRNVDPNWL